jgi:hypothetical protein
VINKIATFPQPLDRQILEIAEGIKNADILTLKVRSLKVYADNAAALAGGLSAGQVYRTSVGVVMAGY